VRDLHGLVWEWVDDFNALMVSADNREQGDPERLKFCGAGALSMQDRDNYGPMKLRSAIVPMVNIGSNLGWILLMIGLVLRLANLAWMGVILFSAGALFSLITVPVELNASKRARQMLTSTGLVVNAEEEKGVSAVLNAAALTYVAGLATSLLQVLYFGSMVGGLGRRR